MSYAAFTDHVDMAFDDRRNQAYRDALTRLPPDSVVMDLGAGIGILGFIALAAGVGRVIMVEPTDAINAARVVAQDLGLEDRIQFVQARIEDCEELEPVDCIVSVFTGNFLLEEDLLPSLYVARDRFLKPGGIMLPDSASMLFAPVSSPRLYEACVDRWRRSAAGVDLSSLRRHAANNSYCVTVDPKQDLCLSEPAVALDVDFGTSDTAACDAALPVDVRRDGLCHGILGWFDMTIGRQRLSTGPDAAQTHWSQVFLPLETPTPMHAGDRVQVSIRRPVHGDWTWSLTADGLRQRQSTFLGTPRSLASLAYLAPSFRPSLSDDGRLALAILSAMDGTQTREALLASLERGEPAVRSERLASELARMITRYARTTW